MKDEKVYDCTNCRYKDPLADFCGLCVIKILDKINEERGVNNGEEDRRENGKDENLG